MVDEPAQITPRPVRRQAEWVRKVLGVEPEVRQLTPTSWRVVLAGQRVVASADFYSSLGKCRWTRGELTVDGRPRKPVKNADELRKLWSKYERPEKPELEPVPESSAPMPTEIAQIYAQLKSRLNAEDNVRAGYAHGRWIIGIDGSDGDGMRIVSHRNKHGRWVLDGDRPVQVIVNGKDRSAEAKGNITKAAALLMQSHPDPGSPGVSPGKPVRGARDAGVETRSMVVIRELKGSRQMGIEDRLEADAAAFRKEAAQLDYDGFLHRTLERLGLQPDDPEAESGESPDEEPFEGKLNLDDYE